MSASGTFAFVNVISSDNVEGEAIFLMSCHQSQDERAYLMSSDDGKDWSLLKHSKIFTPASGNQQAILL